MVETLTSPVDSATSARRVFIRPLISESWLLRHNITIGDGLYVVMAKHLRAELVTTDIKQCTTAPASHAGGR